VRRLLHLAIVLLSLAGLASAAELAHLRNGFTIRHDRREVIGDKTRLYLGNGFVEVPSTEIVDYEHDDTPDPAAPVAAKSIPEHVFDASNATGIDADFLSSVIHHESGFNPNAVSRKGARGLMQLMPDTATSLGVQDSFDPAQNIHGGAAYLRQLLDQYHGDAQKALAAYNAGPHRVRQYNGVPPYRETRAYVAGIIREYNQKKFAEQRLAKTRNSKKTSKGTALPRTASKSSAERPAS